MSTTVILKVAVPVFPWASVALHVTVFGPRGNSEPEAGLHETAAIGPSMLSVAVGFV